MSLNMYVLGQFKLLANDTPIELPSRPAQSLLAFLALTAGTHHMREKIAGMLWPDTTDSNARAYLRQVLWRIRKAFESQAIPCDEFLQISDLNLSFNSQADYLLDADAILQSPEEQTTREIIKNIQLYKGELLPGFYDEWILPERDRFQAAYHQKMTLLIERLIQEARWNETIQWSEQWIRLGQAPEPAFRGLMIAYAQLGDKSMVTSTYQRCVTVLEEDLGVSPSNDTQQLYQQLCIEDAPLRTFKPVKPVRSRPLPEFAQESPVPFEEPVFVAREQELGQLNTFLAQLNARKGNAVFITGEAGSGKTALLTKFTRIVQSTHPDWIVVSGNCNAQTGIGDPYLPFREILELLTGDIKASWDAGAISKSHAMSFWKNLPIAAKALFENGPDLIETFIAGSALLHRIEQTDSVQSTWYAELVELIETKKSNQFLTQPHQATFFEQYTKVLVEISRQVPLVLMIDDLQWADLGSISLLFHLGRQIAGSRIMVIGAYRTVEVSIGRDGERHPLTPIIRELQRIYGKIMINMEQAESRQFMEAYLDSEPNQLGLDFRELLYRQTRGQPLFLIELLRGLQERGDLFQDDRGCWKAGDKLDWETLPARVEAVITERIDRLPQSLQSSLKVASVEGDIFTAEVIAQALNISKQDVLGQLSNDLDRKHRLVKAHSIQRMGEQLLSSYRFRHIQIQKYLYSSLDEVERVYLHEQIGRLLEDLYCVDESTTNLADLSTSTTPIVQLAHHFQEARNIPKAVRYLHLAGERAVQLSAYQDAINHLNNGLILLDQLPASPQRDAQELALLMAIGKTMKGIRGMAPPEVEKVFTRAYYLAQEIGNPEQLWFIISELAVIYYVRANYLRAKEFTQETLRLAEVTQNPVLIDISHWQMGFTFFALGEFSKAQDHLQHIISRRDPIEFHNQSIFWKGTNVILSALSYYAVCTWCLGYPDQAIPPVERAFMLATQLNHPFTMAEVITFGGCLLNELREDAHAQLEHANALIELSERVGLGWLGVAWRHRGEALAMLEEIEEANKNVEKGLKEEYISAAICYGTGVCSKIAYYKAKLGHVESGLQLINDILSDAVTKNEFYSLAEIYRLKAEILLMKGDQNQAEEHYQKSLDLARQQEAKSWELRASLGLATLWISQGKHNQAEQLLSPIYAWFTEGQDTPDLVQAKKLLIEIETLKNAA